MRTLHRNKRSFYYATYLRKEPIMDTDDSGNEMESGEYTTFYSSPILCEANISPANGKTMVEIFGTDLRYDKILLLDDPAIPIDEFAVLWIDMMPEDDDNVDATDDAHTDAIVIGDNSFKMFDYVVERVGRSLNSVAVAARKVIVRG